MTDKKQKSAEVAPKTAAFGQKSTEVQDVSTATDGVTRIISIQGQPLMVTLIAFNRLVGRIKELEAELEAVGAGGVQALSAAPALEQKPAFWVPPERDGVYHGPGDRTITAYRDQMEGWEPVYRAARLAASPTPPALSEVPSMQQVGEAKSRVFLVTQHHSKEGELKQIYGSSLFKILSIHTSLGSAERSRTKAEDAYHELYPGYRQDGVDPLYMWLVQAMEVTAPTPPAEQTATTEAVTTEAGATPGAALGGVYAEMPEPQYQMGGRGHSDVAMRDFADRTHAARLRCKSEQARLATLWGYVRADATTKQATPKAAPAWEHHARKLTQWLHCMSHNDSYFGEPAGLVKQVTGELNRLIGAAPQQEAQEPAGEVVSASCDHATVRWLRQTSSAGGGDPHNSRSWPITGEKVYLAPQPAPDDGASAQELLATLEKLARWEPERDMGPGGRWWVSIPVASGKPSFRAALAAQGGK